MFVIHQEEFMFKLICHSLYAVFIVAVLGVLATPGTVGLSQPAQDPKKQSNQEREYQKIKQFSEKLYAEDTEVISKFKKALKHSVQVVLDEKYSDERAI